MYSENGLVVQNLDASKTKDCHRNTGGEGGVRADLSEVEKSPASEPLGYWICLIYFNPLRE